MERNLFLHDNITQSQSVVSAILGTVREYLLFNLPTDFFKNFQITGDYTSIGDMTLTAAEDHEDIRRPNPSLAINPTLRFDTVGHSPQTQHVFFQGKSQLYSNLRYMDVLFTDDENLRYIRFESRRYKVNLEIDMRFESRMQCYDITSYIRQRMPSDNFFFINDVPMVVAIPNDVVAHCAYSYEKDINDAKSVRDLINIFDSKSIKPIDFKINPQSGNKTIGFIHKQNILCKVEGDPTISEDMLNRAHDNHRVQFTITAEISYPSVFVYLEYKQPGSLVPPNPLIDNGVGVSLNYVMRVRPDYTIGDKVLSFHQQYLTEINTQVDHLPMASVMDPQVAFYIDYLVAEDPEKFKDLAEIDLRVYEDGKFVPQKDANGHSNWEINWATKEVTIVNPKRNYNYGICLYINMKQMKPFLEQHNAYDLDVFDKIR